MSKISRKYPFLCLFEARNGFYGFDLPYRSFYGYLVSLHPSNCFSNERSLHCFLSIGLRPIFQQWTIPHHLQAKTTWESLPQLCNRQPRAPVFSQGLQMWIQHVLVCSTRLIFLTNFTISPINSHSFVTAQLFDKC